MSLKDELSKITRTPEAVALEKEQAKNLKLQAEERQKQLAIELDAKIFYKKLIENIKDNASNGRYESVGKTRKVSGETWVGNDRLKYIRIYESTQVGLGIFRSTQEKKHNWKLNITQEGKLVYEAVQKLAAQEGIECELLVMCRRETVGYAGKTTSTISYHRPGETVHGEWDEWQPYFTMCIRGKVRY